MIRNSLIAKISELIPEAVGNGSSTTVLVNSGSIVYNAIDITTTAIIISIIIVVFFKVENSSIDLTDLHCQIELKKPCTR